MKLRLEREIKELDRKIKEARRAALIAPTLEEKLAGQKALPALEGEMDQKRRSLFESRDELDRQREELIMRIQVKLAQRIANVPLFTILWKLRDRPHRSQRQ